MLHTNIVTNSIEYQHSATRIFMFIKFIRTFDQRDQRDIRTGIREQISDNRYILSSIELLELCVSLSSNHKNFLMWRHALPRDVTPQTRGSWISPPVILLISPEVARYILLKVPRTLILRTTITEFDKLISVVIVPSTRNMYSPNVSLPSQCGTTFRIPLRFNILFTWTTRLKPYPGA